MPSLDKKNKTWTANIQKIGYPRRIKKGFSTKSAAREWERKTFENLKNPKTDITFAAAASEYLTWCERRRKLNTYRQKAFIVRSLITAFQTNPPLKDITSKHIELYLDQRFDDQGGKKANRDLRELKTLFNWLVTRDLCYANPCRNIEPYEEEPFIKYVPPPEDINAVLLQANEFEYDFIQCVYHTAGRMSEIRKLRWEDVIFDTGTVTLWTRKRKGGSLEPDELKINTVLQDILERRYKKRNRRSPWVFPHSSKDGSVPKHVCDKIMPKLCEKAKIKRFGLHAIRHHVAAVMADSKKLSLVEIQKQLRQKRASTTDTYLKSLVMGENRAADILENAQKKVFHTKVHTVPQEKKASSEQI